MKKSNVKIAVAITSILFVIGIVIMLSATSVGFQSGNDAIRRNGGSMETERYYLTIETTINNVRATGMVVALVGGVGVLLSSYIYYKDQ